MNLPPLSWPIRGAAEVLEDGTEYAASTEHADGGHIFLNHKERCGNSQTAALLTMRRREWGAHMSTTSMIIGLALGGLLGALMIVFRNRFRDVFSMLLVVGVVVLAVAVTIWRVDQYHDEKATPAPVAEGQATPPGAGIPAGAPPRAPVGLPPSSMGRGAIGSAAPPAVENPYAGGSK